MLFDLDVFYSIVIQVTRNAVEEFFGRFTCHCDAWSSRGRVSSRNATVETACKWLSQIWENASLICIWFPSWLKIARVFSKPCIFDMESVGKTWVHAFVIMAEDWLPLKSLNLSRKNDLDLWLCWSSAYFARPPFIGFPFFIFSPLCLTSFHEIFSLGAGRSS